MLMSPFWSQPPDGDFSLKGLGFFFFHFTSLKWRKYAILKQNRKTGWERERRGKEVRSKEALRGCVTFAVASIWQLGGSCAKKYSQVTAI